MHSASAVHNAPSSDVYDYIINTQVAQSKILKGMGATFLEDAANPLEEITTADVWQELYQELTSVLQQGSLNLY